MALASVCRSDGLLKHKPCQKQKLRRGGACLRKDEENDSGFVINDE
ncbi:hypothetical protein CKO_01820 [Citrobacter koseri ATCC BAA-895]|uniref:Uncharacterized protein n=1 Tax=Citrobacter koseri (strain ATCC BAA-895 / CDC 4225-83 / SGSC4696) TaxID=290338 RepID=A8AHI5_CITK8|nr:hypothetical protein CKO_01820 [Citrobacter koseri ATCC BAA-895]